MWRKKNIIDFKRIYWFFIWRNLNPLHPRLICAKFGWNWPSGSGEEDFLISWMYFHYFVIISPRKRARPFIWTTLNPFHTGRLWAKVVCNWPGFLENTVFSLVNVLSLFGSVLPLEEGGALHLNKLESPLPKDALCKVCLLYTSDAADDMQCVDLGGRRIIKKR